MPIFWVKNLLIYGDFTEFEAPRGHVTGILEAANCHKVDRFIPVYVGEYRYWWKKACFLNTPSTIFLLVMLVFLGLDTFSFFLFFLGNLLLNHKIHSTQTLSSCIEIKKE